MLSAQKLVNHVSFFPTTVTPFNVESPFNMRALSLLENAAGIPLMNSIGDSAHDIQKILGLNLDDDFNLNTLFDSWLNSGGSVRPTWNNLLKTIRQLKLNDLAAWIETCLSNSVVVEGEEMPVEVCLPILPNNNIIVCVCVCVCVCVGVKAVVPESESHLRNELICYFEQEVASLTEERDILNFFIEEMKYEIKQLRSPIKVEGVERICVIVNICLFMCVITTE